MQICSKGKVHWDIWHAAAIVKKICLFRPFISFIGAEFPGRKIIFYVAEHCIPFVGALLSSIINERRNSKIISSGLILTGHSSTHALQDVQALNSSAEI